MKVIPYLFIILFAFCSNKSSAQPHDIFNVYGISEGLSQGTVHDITADEKGFLWLATNDGLNRFDGYNFHPFTHFENDSLSLPQQEVYSVLSDGKNGLWLGLKNYLVHFDLQTKKVDFKAPTQQAPNIIWVSKEGEYLFYYENGKGLIRYHTKTGKNINISTLPWVQEFLSIRSKTRLTHNIHEVNGVIWMFLSTHGALCLDPFSLEIEIVDLPAKMGAIQQLVKHNNRSHWFSGNNGLFLVNTKGKILMHQPFPQQYRGAQQMGLAKDKQNALWISTYGEGLIRFDIPSKAFTFYNNRYDSHPKAFYHFGMKMMLDSAQNLWVGTNSKGMWKINTSAFRFGYLGKNNGHSNYKLTSEFVRALHYKDSILMIGTNDQGLDIINLKKGILTNYKFEDSKGVRLDNAVLSVLQSTDGSLFAGTYRGGLWQAHQNKLIPIEVNGTTSSQHSVYSIFNLNKHEVIYHIGDKLKVYNTQTKKASQIQFRLPIQFLGKTEGQFYVWSNYEIYHLVIKNNAYQLIPVFKVGDKVLSVCQWDSATLLVGTSRGLWQIGTDEIRHITDVQGLPNNTFYGLFRGGDNALWASTNKGLVQIDLKTLKHINYLPPDGVQGTEFNSGASFKSDDGTLWFGGMKGVSWFNPKNQFISTKGPTVQLTKIEVFDQKLTTTTAPEFITELKLPYQQNTLTFRFTALGFAGKKISEYQYKLIGIDTAWVSIYDQRSARYAGLNPGEYTFKFRAKSPHSLWGKATEVKILIDTPFWMSWWFKTIIIALFLVLIMGVLWFISQRKLKKRLRAIELRELVYKERSRISRELHDNIGSQLTYIIMNLDNIDTAYFSNGSSLSPVKSQINGLGDFARNTMQELRDAVWSLNSKNMTYLEFYDRLETYLIQHLGKADTPKWEIDWQVNPDLQIQPLHALNLFRVFQEAITNCLKYAQATQLKIEVNQNKKKQLQILIYDNGVGFNITNQEEGYGLNNMQLRIKELQGEIAVQSTPNKGTGISIVVPT